MPLHFGGIIIQSQPECALLCTVFPLTKNVKSALQTFEKSFLVHLSQIFILLQIHLLLKSTLNISNKSFRFSRITKKGCRFFLHTKQKVGFLDYYITMNFRITDTVYPLCQSLIKKISLLTHATAKIAKPRKMTFR